MEDKIEAYLEELDLNPRDRGHYWLIHCPRSENHNNGDRSPSAQCFKDGWVQCNGGCGRFHIDTIRRERGEKPIMSNEKQGVASGPKETKPKEKEVYGDFTEMWLGLDPLPSTMDVKGVPAIELNKRGWRMFPGGAGLMPGIFIPYFTLDRKTVCFYQIRHLQGERRFSFASGYTPTLYGLENLAKAKQFVAYTEGSRDAVILNMVGVPAVALPSASSANLLHKLCDYCIEHSLMLFAICDKDKAGDALIRELTCPAIDMRTPVGKDIGDFFEEQGLEAVRKYYAPIALSEAQENACDGKNDNSPTKG